MLGGIAVPPLIVVGRDDAFTPISDAWLMHDRINSTRLAIVEGAGHMPNLSRRVIGNSQRPRGVQRLTH
jgi:pimeloyl-ACP methyl ester carboxylesterase